MKTCSSCKQDKSYSEFYKRADTKDGYQYLCIECSTDYVSQPAVVERKNAARRDSYNPAHHSQARKRRLFARKLSR